MLDMTKFYSLNHLMFTQGQTVSNFCIHSVDKLHAATSMILVIDCEREMTVNKSFMASIDRLSIALLVFYDMMHMLPNK